MFEYCDITKNKDIFSGKKWLEFSIRKYFTQLCHPKLFQVGDSLSWVLVKGTSGGTQIMQKWVDYLHTKKIYSLKCEYFKLTILSKNIYLFFLNFHYKLLSCHSKSSKIKGIRIIELEIVKYQKGLLGIWCSYYIHNTWHNYRCTVTLLT